MSTLQNERRVFEIGDLVVYRLDGIFKVIDIRNAQFGKLQERLYYVLSSVSDTRTTVYVPVEYDCNTRLRKVIEVSDIDDIIDEVEKSDQQWIEDPKTRSNDFNNKLFSGDLSLCLWVIKALSIYQSILFSKGKKLYASDERVLDSCRRYVYTEFSFVTGLPISSIDTLINSKIKKATSIPGLQVDG